MSIGFWQCGQAMCMNGASWPLGAVTAMRPRLYSSRANGTAQGAGSRDDWAPTRRERGAPKRRQLQGDLRCEPAELSERGQNAYYHWALREKSVAFRSAKERSFAERKTTSRVALYGGPGVASPFTR